MHLSGAVQVQITGHARMARENAVTQTEYITGQLEGIDAHGIQARVALFALRPIAADLAAQGSGRVFTLQHPRHVAEAQSVQIAVEIGIDHATVDL